MKYVYLKPICTIISLWYLPNGFLSGIKHCCYFDKDAYSKMLQPLHLSIWNKIANPSILIFWWTISSLEIFHMFPSNRWFHRAPNNKVRTPPQHFSRNPPNKEPKQKTPSPAFRTTAVVVVAALPLRSRGVKANRIAARGTPRSSSPSARNGITWGGRGRRHTFRAGLNGRRRYARTGSRPAHSGDPVFGNGLSQKRPFCVLVIGVKLQSKEEK